MPASPGRGTLLIAALLVLGLAFAASWISYYVDPGHDPRSLVPWFGLAVVVILVVALLAYLRPGGGKDGG